MGKCRPLADSEIEALKSYTPDVRDRCILIALEKTGYRANEVASLKTDDVFDFSSQTLKPRVQVKREHMKKKQGRRSIPLHPDLRSALTLWLAKLAAKRLPSPWCAPMAQQKACGSTARTVPRNHLAHRSSRGYSRRR